MKQDFSSVKRLFHIYSILYGLIFYSVLHFSKWVTVTRPFTRLSVFKDKRLHDHVFFHSDTFYGQRLLSLKNNGKVHLHLIIQYEKNTDFFRSNQW